jgi:hypothetical protein
MKKYLLSCQIHKDMSDIYFHHYGKTYESYESTKTL